MRQLSTEAKLAMMAQAAHDFIAMDNIAMRTADHKLDGVSDCIGHMQMEFLRQLGNFTQNHTVSGIPGPHAIAIAQAVYCAFTGLDITLEKKPT